MSIFILWVLCFLTVHRSAGQDLANLDKKKPVKISGGLNATQTFYHAWDIPYRRDPYYWLLNANLTVDVLGVSIPFSANISQQQKYISYTQPFNQWGLSPRYKSVTAHIGYRSMQFSNFTLGGNVFLGGGVEINPSSSWVRVAAMYGRFAKAVSADVAEGAVTGQPSFERWGWGTKVSLGKLPANSVDLIAFKASDVYRSLPRKLADSAFHLKPAENLVLGVVARRSLTEKINLDVEYAFSAYTEDSRLGYERLEKFGFYNSLGPVFTANMSTQFNKAVLANLAYNERLFQFRITYRRIDPEYKTMGSVFLNNDLEDVTGNLSWRMFSNKMNFTTGAGIQRNNLDNSLASRMKRFIGNFNWSYVVNRRLNLNASYSNFMANTRINNTRMSANQLGLFQNADSLAYNQVTNSATGGVNYTMGTDSARHTLFSNGNFQKANDNQGNGSLFYNITSGYQLGIIPMGLNLSVSVVYNNSLIKSVDTRSAGPNFSMSKLLFDKKMRATVGATHLRTYSEGSLTGSNTMFRMASSYKNGKHHNVGMDMTYLKRSVRVGTGTSFREFRGSIIYGFTF